MAQVGDGSLDLVMTDAGDLYDRAIRAAEQAVGEPLFPFDERRIFIEAILAVILPVSNAIQDAARQVMLRFAKGEVLDALGERLGVTRLAGIASVCTFRFSLDAPRKYAIVIPKWTHARGDDEVYFATDRDAIIEAGETSVDVEATCTAPGSLGNGYPADSITTMVEQIAYVNKVTNLDETHGGDDGETYDDEGDERFRERIRLAPESLSVAGPREAYEYWAKTADAGISDVKAISVDEEFERELEVIDGKCFMGGDLLIPEGTTVNGQSDGFTVTFDHSLMTIELQEPLSQEETVTVRTRHKMDGRVRIVPLMEGGEIPGEDVLQRVLDAVSADDVRPMTDVVTVDAPTVVEYPISLTYWTTATEEGAVVEAVEGVGGVIDQFIAEQCAVLGRDVNPDVLKTMVMNAGAIRAEVTEPVHKAIGDGEVARFDGSRTVSHEVETMARWED